MTSPEAIKVVIADDHEIFLDGLKLILSRNKDVQVLGSAGNGQQLIALCKSQQPDVVLTDIKMPKMDGIEAAKYLTEHHPNIGIIALSMFDEENLIMEMLNSGARGYLLKNSDKTEIMEAIRAVASHENYYCRQTSSKLALMIARTQKRRNNAMPAIEFSEREKEVIKLICQEHTNREIGDKLFLSTRTVEGYRLKLLEKMHVKNSIGIVVYAIQHGLVTLENQA